MIRYIKGNLMHKAEASVIIENRGVGYNINVPMSSNIYQKNLGEEVEIFTSMIVREDDISLYGFSDMKELELFEKLITVNGVGAKAAVAIFSALNGQDIRLAIASGDDALLTRANGIGKKTAQRIILDLKDKLDMTSVEPVTSMPGSSPAVSGNTPKMEALAALEEMGFPRNEISIAMKNIEEEDLKVEEYIKRLLKYFA